MTAKGLTLVEVLVTLVILTVGLGMLLQALTRSLRDNERLHEMVQSRYTTESTRLLAQALPGRSS